MPKQKERKLCVNTHVSWVPPIQDIRKISMEGVVVVDEHRKKEIEKQEAKFWEDIREQEQEKLWGYFQKEQKNLEKQTEEKIAYGRQLLEEAKNIYKKEEQIEEGHAHQ